MTNEIRILILEDVAADVVRINHSLREAGMNFRSKRVETRRDFLFELEHHPPDVILSDHGLPSFDGFTALAIARDKCPGTPFIFVTGALGEQVTAETFRSGATDYVMKHQLAKLAPAVERALYDSQARGKHDAAEANLREQEEQLQTLLEGIKDYAIFMLDIKGRVTFWNAGAQWVHGHTAAEITGRHFSLLYPEGEAAQDKPQQALHVAVRDGRFEEEGPRVRKSGKTFMANVTITALRTPKGSVLRGYAVVTRDIDGRLPAEEQLRRSEALKTAILDTALDAIISIDHAGLIQEWNPAARRIFGYSREQVVGKLVDDLIIPASLLEVYRDGVANYLIHGVGSLLGKPIELTLKRKNGAEFRAELAISRATTEDPPRCTALVRDITEKKRSEAALREIQERYRTLVENVKDYAIYMLDPEGRVTTWNAGAEHIKGYTAAEIIGQPFSIFFTPEDVARNLPAQLLEQARQEGQAVYDGQRVRKNGQRFWIKGIITAMHSDDGSLQGFSKVARDITQQKEADEKIQQLNEQLEERVIVRTAQLQAANKELEAFSYSVSHDLRAPLLHISGYADILLGEAGSKLDEKLRRYLQNIADGARQMSHLIDALLDFSRMGRAEMRHGKLDMNRLVKEAQRELQREFEGRDIEWNINDLPEARGDAFMLRQAFISLISNALKYTRTRKPAKIEIGAKTEGTGTTYFIRDNGVGFDMKYVGKLFGVFQRLHRARDFEGTGIGLANVRRIIQRHGGRAWAEGAVDQGATFYFSLPHQSHKPGYHEKIKMDTVGGG